MPKGRLEAFSDGVFAIAVTLLVLDIKAPSLGDTAEGARLLDALRHQWPSYLAFVTSFLTILIMWINHHVIFRTVERVDHTLLLANGLLLLCVTVIPFPTELLAEHIRGEGQQVAAAVYSGVSTVLALAFNLLRVMADQRHGTESSADALARQRLQQRYLAGPLLYFMAFLCAFISA